MEHSEKAQELFACGYHCSQAVFAAFAEEMGMDKDTALKIGGSFGGGMRKGEVCGACTGALMAIGLKYGQFDIADADSRALTDKLTIAFLDAFAKENGSYLCRELLGYNFAVPEEFEAAKQAGICKEKCPKMVASAAKILDKIFAENNNSAE